MRLVPAVLALMVGFGVVRGVAARPDDVAVLPLGDPARAYLLASGDAGQVIDCRLPGDPSDPRAKRAPALEMKDFIADLGAADVVIIGESHTDIGVHRMQWKIVEDLAATGRPLALGMEFFEVTDDEALATYSTGVWDTPTLVEKTDWYAGGGGFNFEYYRPMLETCRTKHFPVYGLNIPREWVRTISHRGIEGLTPEQRAYVGDLGVQDPRHRYAISHMLTGLAASMPEMFDGMYKGQAAWDAAMATSIARACRKFKEKGEARTFVAIVGAGHMGHGLGIPQRLAAMEPSLKVRTVAPAKAHKPGDDEVMHPGVEKKETAIFSRGYADYVFVIADDGEVEEYPQIGVRLEHPKGAASPAATPLRIASVTPGGIAERAGLKKGDTVISIGNDKPLTPSHAGQILASLRWNDRVRWTVLRAGGGGETEIPMLVLAPTDGDMDWLKSKPASTLLDTFDPVSEKSYLEPDKKSQSEAPHARLVSFRDKAVRIDVMRGSVLLETWKLDEAGRTIEGFYSTPAPDGAVKVQIDRDAAGKVTAVKRFNGLGEKIEAGAKDPHADIGK